MDDKPFTSCIFDVEHTTVQYHKSLQPALTAFLLGLLKNPTGKHSLVVQNDTFSNRLLYDDGAHHAADQVRALLNFSFTQAPESPVVEEVA
jgi:hypothetical protein